METYTDTLPPLWWLRPWHHARRLHAAVTALRGLFEEESREHAITINEKNNLKAKAEEDAKNPWLKDSRIANLRASNESLFAEVAKLTEERDALKARFVNRRTMAKAKPVRKPIYKKGAGRA